MSQIGGKKKEVKQSEGFSKYIGFFKGEVVAINPDRKALNKLLGREDSEDDKEIEYTGEKDGTNYVDVSFWLAVEGKDGVYLNHKIRVKDEIRRNRLGDKIQLINQVGDTTWVEADEDNEYETKSLFENFTHFTKVNSWVLPNGEKSDKWSKGAKPAADGVEILGEKIYRPAMPGEEELATFMKSWLSQIDYRDVDANILLDTKSLIKGNVKDLKSSISGEFDRPFVALAYVRTDEEDPDKQYQKVFAKHLLPATFMKFINNGARFPNKYSQDTWDKFIAEVEGEYGIDGSYVLEPLKEYDPNDDITTSKKTKADVTDTNSGY